MQSSSMWDGVFSLFVSRRAIVKIEAPETVPDGLNVCYFGG